MPAITKTIGILGGTFDPIHFGHLRMAVELYEAFDLAKIHMIPCYQPVHRALATAKPEDRMQMLKLAVQDYDFLIPDAREIKRQSPSYTIDTLLSFREEKATHSIAILMGSDAFLGFNSWHRYQEILQHAHLIVAHRPNYQFPSAGPIADLMRERLQHQLSFMNDQPGGGIFLYPITALDISASDIRKQISSNKNPAFLLPQTVHTYIKQQGIYL